MSMTTDDQNAANRRIASRFDVSYDLQVDIEGENVPYTGMIKDISSGGLFITTDEDHEVGDIVQLRFTFPTLESAIDCKGRVQWLRDRYTAGDMAQGVGVQFVDLPEDARLAINAFISDKEVPFFEEGF
jgi:uncharacterized protein (TIGR02266 family)